MSLAECATNLSRSDFLSPAGFQDAVSPMLPSLKRYARRLVGSASDVDDLVQDTLVRAWSARSRFIPGTNLRAWLMRIARNCFLSARRRAGRQVSWEPETIERTLVIPPEEEAAIHMSDFEEALNSLPEVQQQAFNAVVSLGLTYGEAAEQLHVPENTLKSRVARARFSIVRSMEALPSEPSENAETGPDVPGDRLSVYERWKRSGTRLIGLVA